MAYLVEHDNQLGNVHHCPNMMVGLGFSLCRVRIYCTLFLVIRTFFRLHYRNPAGV